MGAARHLREQFADHSLAILEAMDGFGGTWWTHRYPGARSDSDLFTYGYGFKPWTGNAIAAADEIRHYLAETIEESDLAPADPLRPRGAIGPLVLRRQALDAGSHAQRRPRCGLTTGFLWVCAGYYDHGRGYTPEWPTLKDFKGQVILRGTGRRSWITRASASWS